MQISKSSSNRKQAVTNHITKLHINNSARPDTTIKRTVFNIIYIKSSLADLHNKIDTTNKYKYKTKIKFPTQLCVLNFSSGLTLQKDILLGIR